MVFGYIEQGTLTVTTTVAAVVTRQSQEVGTIPAETAYTMSIGDPYLSPANSGGEWRNAGNTDVVVLAAIVRPAGDATPAASTDTTAMASTPCPAATGSDTEALARRFVEERMSNPPVLQDLLADEVAYHRAYTTAVLTVDEAQDTMQAVLDAFLDIHVTVDHVIVKGDTATVIRTAEGTHLGQLRPWNAPATGKHTSWEEISVVRVKCGRIGDVWNQIDYLALLHNLGVVTDAEMAANAMSATPAA